MTSQAKIFWLIKKANTDKKFIKIKLKSCMFY